VTTSCNFRPRCGAPDFGTVLLEAHHREVLGCSGADAAVGHQLVESIDRQCHVDVAEEVIGPDVEVDRANVSLGDIGSEGPRDERLAVYVHIAQNIKAVAEW
jgi:hypothetical protein